MGMAYLVVTIVAAAMAAFSGLGKLRHDPKIVLCFAKTLSDRK
jgi:hypothetical protein